jgi:hypothetical protein
VLVSVVLVPAVVVEVAFESEFGGVMTRTVRVVAVRIVRARKMFGRGGRVGILAGREWW